MVVLELKALIFVRFDVCCSASIRNGDIVQSDPEIKQTIVAIARFSVSKPIKARAERLAQEMSVRHRNAHNAHGEHSPIRSKKKGEKAHYGSKQSKKESDAVNV